MPFGRKRGAPALEDYERKALEDYLTSLAQVEPLMGAVRELIRADGDAERRTIVAREPELASERGAAALKAVVTFAMMTGLVGTLPRLQALQEWQRSLGDPSAAAEKPEPPESVPEVLDAFIGAAIRADQAFLRTGDLGDIALGIEIWQQLQASGALAPLPPEALVDAQLMVAMLHARRYEVEHDDDDLDAAFGYRHEAQPHVVPGSRNDLTMRASAANWLMLRYEVHGDPQDLDGAIAGYEELREVAPAGDESAAISAANIGRALLIRHETSGTEADLRRAREMLWEAERTLPAGHAARAVVQREQARASWR